MSRICNCKGRLRGRGSGGDRFGLVIEVVIEWVISTCLLLGFINYY